MDFFGGNNNLLNVVFLKNSGHLRAFKLGFLDNFHGLS